MSSTTVEEYDVLVVGAGFGGCYLLHLLRKNGFKVKVLEAGTTLGGVWCWNVSFISLSHRQS
jgi:cation diffusion facilitator CzcD-associated flavoprotein CzcO